MSKSLLLFENSPWLILVALILGAGYTFILYNSEGEWSKTLRLWLAALRFVLVTIISILLIGPILRQLLITTEKPFIVFAIDNSKSVSETTDSITLIRYLENINILKSNLEDNGYQTLIKSLDGTKNYQLASDIQFNYLTTDINSLLKSIQAEYEGRNLKSVVLLSDGIYNLGTSPNFSNFKYNIFTLGLGDTIPRRDIAISSLKYNKISYQGNRFPLVVEITNDGYFNETLTVLIKKDNKTLHSESIKLLGDNQLSEVKFILEADEKGLQRYQVELSAKEGELTYKNNIVQAYIDIVDGREKILFVAPSPHPDIKAIRSAIESNKNYEFQLYIPGIHDLAESKILENKYDLVIFHQVPDRSRKLLSLYHQLVDKDVSTLLIVGHQSNLRDFNQLNGLMNIQAGRYQADQVNAIYNSLFMNFTLSEDLQAMMGDLPPVFVPFGKITLMADAQPLLYQKVGSVETKNPLLLLGEKDGRKIGILLGEGSWRWKLHEYSVKEQNILFNEFYSKLVQYLSSKEDKRKFKVYPVNKEVSKNESILFKTEHYNDLYERIYGIKVDLVITDEEGNVLGYTYLPNEGTSIYRVSNLERGVYKYKATSSINGKVEEITGEFVVKDTQIENINLTADHSLLRNLADRTSGKFYLASQINELERELYQRKYPGILHSNEAYLPLINLKALFFIFLLLVSIEWFMRKYHGSY